MRLMLLVCALACACAVPAFADLRQSATAIHISAPNAAWELQAPKGAWQLKEERRRQDGLAFFYVFSDPNTKINAAFYVEPAERCRTSADCRSLFWSSPEPVYRDPESVKQFEENGFAVVAFTVPRIGDKPAGQLNYSAHHVREGFWIEVHLSKLQAQKGDAAAFSDILRSISFQRRVAAADLPSRPEERRYPVADRRFLAVTVPSSWHEIIRQPSEKAPTTILFRPASGAPFEVLMTPVWDTTGSAQAPMLDAVRQRVQEMADAFTGMTVERSPKVLDLKGAGGRGYYFSATLREPRPGELKYLAQGILAVGELAVTFTIRADSRKDQAVQDAFAMLTGAVIKK